MVAKTVLSAAVTSMRDQYTSAFGNAESEQGHRCFELLGIDVMLDERLRPYLLEVNMSPSAAMGTALDMIVKESVHQEALSLAAQPPCPESEFASTSTPEERATVEAAWRTTYEDKVLNGFKRILPAADKTTKKATIYQSMLEYTKGGSSFRSR